MNAITYELWMLFAAFGITAFSIFVQGMHLGAAAGNAYVVSDRSEPAPFEGPIGGRLARNVRNQIEGMSLFVPLVRGLPMCRSMPLASKASAPWLGLSGFSP